MIILALLKLTAQAKRKQNLSNAACTYRASCRREIEVPHCCDNKPRIASKLLKELGQSHWRREPRRSGGIEDVGWHASLGNGISYLKEQLHLIPSWQFGSAKCLCSCRNMNEVEY